MELYFGNLSSENKIILDENESNHLIHVKRFQTGDTVYVTDGEGKIFTTELNGVEKKQCTLSVKHTETKQKNPYRLHLAISPTKNIDRMEWFVEKATELGIDEISFLQCRHSERKEIREDRLMRVAVAAMKQSVKAFLPVINPMIDFKKFVSGNLTGTRLICTMTANETDTLKTVYKKGHALVALIGPEGDFHSEEIELATNTGFKQTSLGQARLRTETAALTVCTLFNFINA